ncbi:hypothetical protein A3V60_20060 [Salmonella enterica subsp. enterica serovar Enteritidis]|nr:hypothetical protein [Salmonella enterica subsp. enterica serovar Enteritidis]ECC9066999.1 hypothetical protein [Salmonella enterica subsp. diarizonae]ECY5112810.1 hypothetical protein [Salmonella enterica subsp. enterica serovar Typhimurium]EEM3073583.1 hypothetical protein [Salmonella enterica subsp. enterica serovar Java]ECZ9369401.1 hypothetical protein [Salmonella enterica subsp. enterica serovar Enteritidis]
MNKIIYNIEGANSSETTWKERKNMSNDGFKNLLVNQINKNETKNSGVNPLTSRTLNNIVESFTHQIKQLNIQPKEPVNISNLSKEQQYIIEDMEKSLKNRLLFSIRTNELLNHIDFEKCHFIKI